jgi:hypothetical protein
MKDELVVPMEQPGYGRNLPGKASVYVYVGHNRGVAVDVEGNKKRNEWVKLDLEVKPDEVIRKIAYRGKDEQGADFGSNSAVLFMDDMNRHIADLMTLCEAMITNEKQQEAWKKLLRDGFWDWYNDIFHRYNLELSDTNETTEHK